MESISIEYVGVLMRKCPEFKARWMRIFEDEVMKQLRHSCHELFTENHWLDTFQQMSMHTPEELSNVMKRLFEKIVENLNDLQDQTADEGHKHSLFCLVEKLKKDYSDEHYELINKFGMCMRYERDLVQRFISENPEAMQTNSVRDLTDGLEQMKEEVDMYLGDMSRICDEVRQTTSAISQLESTTMPQINGTIQNQDPFRQLNPDMQIKKKKYRELYGKVIKLLQCCLLRSEDALFQLDQQMSCFKQDLNKAYLDLTDRKPNLPLELEEGFSALGKTLFELLYYTIQKAKQLEIPVEEDQFVDITRKTFERSFIVIDQKKHFVKVELGTKKQKKEEKNEVEEDEDETTKNAPNQKFKCPKFTATVRLLAADKIENRSTVQAVFCQEQEINRMCSNNSWDAKCRYQLKSSTNLATFEKKKKALANFKKLELENFERKQSDRHVCEDKFRLLFKTNIIVGDVRINVQTISLPIVVITGASQSCNVYGSLLWQCCNTEDAFAYPIPSKEHLPWSCVFEMLNQKFLALQGRELSPEEKAHLGSRLMHSKEDVKGSRRVIDDSTMVPFRKFCIDKMMDIMDGDEKKRSATFWTWVNANYNLVKIHLSEYWKKNLIAGFVSKEAAKRLLLINAKTPCPGLYLIRFSDTVITDSQGQNVCGAVSAAFLHYEGDHLNVHHAEPFSASTLKKKSLYDNIRRMTATLDQKTHVLEYLYPDGVSTEEAFKDFSNEGNKNKGNIKGYTTFEEMLLMKIDNMTIDEENPRPKKRASRRTKQGGKQPKIEELSIRQNVTSNPQIPHTVYEHDSSGGSNSSRSQDTSSGSFSNFSSSDMTYNFEMKGSGYCPPSSTFSVTEQDILQEPTESFLAALESPLQSSQFANNSNLQGTFANQDHHSTGMPEMNLLSGHMRTPSLENPTLANLLQNPVSMPTGVTSTSQTYQTDMVLSRAPAVALPQTSLGERKITPSKPLASKIESFKKLENKLLSVQSSCSDNFPVAPSPADSGISVNSPNPHLMTGDCIGGQPNSGDFLPMSEQGNIPNLFEQNSEDSMCENYIDTPESDTHVQIQNILSNPNLLQQILAHLSSQQSIVQQTSEICASNQSFNPMHSQSMSPDSTAKDLEEIENAKNRS